MTYTVKMHEKWSQPYSFADLSQMCQHESNETYSVQTSQMCKQVIKDLLDAPNEPLTVEQVIEDFESFDCKLTEQQVNNIQTYYNGRLALQQQIYRDIDTSTSGTFRYDIPEQYNRFSRCDDEYDKCSKQLDAFIELKIEDIGD